MLRDINLILKTIATVAVVLYVSRAFGSDTRTLRAEGQIEWTGNGIGKSHYGTLALKSGEVTVSGKNIVGGQFIFDMNSIREGTPRLEKHLKSSDFFDVQKYPEAKFIITKVTPIVGAKPGLATLKIIGNLTIRDVTQSLELVAKIEDRDGKFFATGDLVIPDRTKFGIVYHSQKFETMAALGDKLISDEISVTLKISASK
jgi:polyisoprenoid-binding protein YceI